MLFFLRLRRPPRSTRTDTLCPSSPLFRSEYGTTRTTTPGVRFCEYLPQLARRAHRFSVVRTMHHPTGREFRNEHNSCTYLLKSEEHTSELQSLMRISYAVFCLNKKKKQHITSAQNRHIYNTTL